MAIQTPFKKPVEPFTSSQQRTSERFNFRQAVEWDFYSAGNGRKAAFLENISESGCLLRANDAIEHRRWIRFVVKSREHNLWFTAVGKIVRRDDRLEAWDEDNVTLHRYGVEFMQPLNEVVLERIKSMGRFALIA